MIMWRVWNQESVFCIFKDYRYMKIYTNHPVFEGLKIVLLWSTIELKLNCVSPGIVTVAQQG